MSARWIIVTWSCYDTIFAVTEFDENLWQREERCGDATSPFPRRLHWGLLQSRRDTAACWAASALNGSAQQQTREAREAMLTRHHLSISVWFLRHWYACQWLGLGSCRSPGALASASGCSVDLFLMRWKPEAQRLAWNPRGCPSPVPCSDPEAGNVTLRRAFWAAGLGFSAMPAVRLQQEGVGSVPSQNLVWCEGLLGSRSHLRLTRACKVPTAEANPSRGAPANLPALRVLHP